MLSLTRIALVVMVTATEQWLRQSVIWCRFYVIFSLEDPLLAFFFTIKDNVWRQFAVFLSHLLGCKSQVKSSVFMPYPLSTHTQMIRVRKALSQELNSHHLQRGPSGPWAKSPWKETKTTQPTSTQSQEEEVLVPGDDGSARHPIALHVFVPLPSR